MQPAPDVVDFAAELHAAVDARAEALRVPATWEGFPGAAFGAFAAGAVLVAAAARARHPRPLSLFARFHRPVPLEREVALSLGPERSGRSVETFAARLVDGDRLLASFSAAFGRVGDVPLATQAARPMPPLVNPRPVWEHLVEIGLEPSPLMRRIGFRGETEPATEERDDDWHLAAQWPACASREPAVQAAVAMMAIDSFVGPALMRANRLDLDAPWPVIVPSLDLTGWFYEPEAGTRAGEWLAVRTSVPVTGAGYAVGRTQVWAGEVLAAEGLSQVALLPAPAA